MNPKEVYKLSEKNRKFFIFKSIKNMIPTLERMLDDKNPAAADIKKGLVLVKSWLEKPDFDKYQKIVYSSDNYGIISQIRETSNAKS